MAFTASDICKIIFAIILPPLGVFLERGCTADLLINCLLTLLGSQELSTIMLPQASYLGTAHLFRLTSVIPASIQSRAFHVYPGGDQTRCLGVDALMHNTLYIIIHMLPTGNIPVAALP
ncbi:hypothetical protein F4604DRAFT_1673143 [Suillus subluteus]|nr:hypothetical protein F4604DRAFT_1673143 [Suillus subluteus]